MRKAIYILLIVLASACQVKSPSSDVVSEDLPPVFPDYNEVVLPVNIGSIYLETSEEIDGLAMCAVGSQEGEIWSSTSERYIGFDDEEWSDLLSKNVNGTLSIVVKFLKEGKWTEYKPLIVTISSDSIDYGLVYRLIPPGYEGHADMGIYEYDFSTSNERALFENTKIKRSCVNCHSFNKCNPQMMSVHFRGTHGATILQQENKRSVLNTRTRQTVSGFVYPYWHHGGRYVAYSNTIMHQSFYPTKGRDIEVVDEASDVIIYDTETETIIKSNTIASRSSFESFPVFSSKGDSLYYISAESRRVPDEIFDIKYSLCGVSFDAATAEIGTNVDTLIASGDSISISYPRPSYDGRFIVFTVSKYGYFHLYHQDSDLWILDLKTRKCRPLTLANSNCAESWHTLSSNSRWLAFVSRRVDNRYGRVFITHLDSLGNETKAFILPQRRPLTADMGLFDSYNCPEFVVSPTPFEEVSVSDALRSSYRKDVKTIIVP